MSINGNYGSLKHPNFVAGVFSDPIPHISARFYELIEDGLRIHQNPGVPWHDTGVAHILIFLDTGQFMLLRRLYDHTSVEIDPIHIAHVATLLSNETWMTRNDRAHSGFGRRFLTRISAFEIVDGRQWEGAPPAQLPYSTMWDIHTTYDDTERLLFSRSHWSRDHVFRLKNQIELLFRSVVPLIETHYDAYEELRRLYRDFEEHRDRIWEIREFLAAEARAHYVLPEQFDVESEGIVPRLSSTPGAMVYHGVEIQSEKGWLITKYRVGEKTFSTIGAAKRHIARSMR